MPVLLTELQKYMVGQALMYMQHRLIVCGELCICHDLYLNQNVYDNAYPTSLLHEALYVNHKMVMLGIGWYHNNFSHLCGNINIILNMILSVCPFSYTGYFTVFPMINEYMFTIILRHTFFWNSLFILTSIFYGCKNAV